MKQAYLLWRVWRVWRQFPALRLCQLLVNAVRDEYRRDDANLFYATDAELLHAINEFEKDYV